LREFEIGRLSTTRTCDEARLVSDGDDDDCQQLQCPVVGVVVQAAASAAQFRQS
jgi:hypothetical protein